jgi:hypothetical protein
MKQGTNDHWQIGFFCLTFFAGCISAMNVDMPEVTFIDHTFINYPFCWHSSNSHFEFVF